MKAPKNIMRCFERIGQGNRRGRGTHIADDAEHLILLVELLHGFGGACRLVAVVDRDELDLSPMHAAGVVDDVERGLDAKLHLAAQLLGRPRERR